MKLVNGFNKYTLKERVTYEDYRKTLFKLIDKEILEEVMKHGRPEL